MDVSHEVCSCFSHFAGQKAYLDVQDMKLAWLDCFAHCPSKHDVRRTCLKMGIDPERVTLKDFSRVVTPRLLQRDVDDEVRNMFKAIDWRGTGFITVADLEATLSMIGVVLPEQVLAAIFAEADADGDGRVTFREFERLLSITR